jgi:hypothetical protein
MRAACVAIFLLISGPAWPQPAFDLTRLMQLLAESSAAEVPYVEKKYSSLLSEPVVSSGTLAYKPPDVVEKIMTAPRRESYRIAGQELTVTRDGKERRIALAAEPLLAAFAASLRGLLSGSAGLLGAHYRMALTGTEREWSLELVPIEDEVTRYVKRIVASGRAGRVAQIEVFEASGDRSVTQVR